MAEFPAFPPEPPLSTLPAPLSLSSRRRTLRWGVPVVVIGAVAAVASGVFSATANPNLAPQTAAQLLGSINDARTAAFSGTVVEKASLGLPELPSIAGADSSSGIVGMLSGSHTVRVWYAGPTKQRIAVLDSFGEQDVFRNGRDVWQWNSDTKQSSHTVLPAAAAEASPTQVPRLTPADAAQQALAMIDPSTVVTTDSTGTVAGRSTYTLVLTPKDTRSRVGSVRISLDGRTKVPLGLQVIARGQSKAALDISFTRVDFSTPDDDNFTFAPPAGVPPVKQEPLPAPRSGTIKPGTIKPGLTPPGENQPGTRSGMTTIGTGWTTIAKLTGVSPLSAAATKQDGQSAAILGSLPAVSGSWGKGRLFTSALITALITDDGRVYVGAVDPDMLYQAASAK